MDPQDYTSAATHRPNRWLIEPSSPTNRSAPTFVWNIVTGLNCQRRTAKPHRPNCGPNPESPFVNLKLPKKEICKWNRATLEESLPLLAMQITEAKYVCKKCGRAVADKRLLCKPTKLAPLLEQPASSET